MNVVAVLIALFVGFVGGCVFQIIAGHTALVKASTLYRELLIRGDAAIAGLAHTAKKLEELGNGKRVILAEDLTKIKNALKPPVIIKE